ncbi:hypothetical protein [Ekhidna sp.]
MKRQVSKKVVNIILFLIVIIFLLSLGLNWGEFMSGFNDGYNSN